MKKAIPVELGKRRYMIYLGSGNLSSLGMLCRRHRVPEHIVVLADTNSARAGLRKALASLRAEGFRPASLSMPSGERQKSLARAGSVHSQMLRMRLPRGATLVALGGGVVGDVAGFVAATYRRGITLVQCPTTLLSQVDSSVGGKNGVNHPLGKNAIGSFLQPRFVLSDTLLLRSLPPREVRSGLGEILKYPFVADPTLMRYINRNLDRIIRLESGPVSEVAHRCLKIKARFVSTDETEQKSDGRARLNFGHAVGHAIETLSNYRLRHGEAVFLGLIAEADIAVRRGWLSMRYLEELVDIYHRLGCRYSLKGISDSSLIQAIFSTRQTRFVIPRRFGRVTTVKDVTKSEALAGLKILRRL